jgi:alkanesulfonate monooxygenase SsuD/methylene tetrahydromethanopterin reductase-like flavin-dependent oxidoreductase (luciferase family)
VRLGILPFAAGSSLVELERSWQAAEEAGFDDLWTVDHTTASAQLGPAWEASSLLVAMAARTRAISVGVLVFDVFLRHPFILAGAAAVAQALSGGRVRVGLGIGDKFSRLDHEALSLPFPPFSARARFLEGCCRAFPRLWRGDTVTDPSLGLNEAALGPVGITPPPLIVGGGSRMLMELAVRYADGWNLFTNDPEAFAIQVQGIAELEAVSTRSRPLQRSAYFFVDSQAGDLRKVVEAFEAVGADELMLVIRRPSAEAVLTLARQLR